MPNTSLSRWLSIPILFTAAVVLAAETTAPAPAPKFDDAKLRVIHSAMNGFVATKDISGAVTLLVTRDGVAWLDAAGESDIAKHTPMKTDSVFWIASMTKPITATCILMLQDEGKLSINDPVEKYIPALGELKGPDDQPANITLKHMLTHTSGMGDGGDRGAKTLADAVAGYAKTPMQSAPGEKWKYNQPGIISLGRVIEVVSGMSYVDFVQKRIFDPLGMKDSSYYPNKELQARLAKSYKKDGDNLVETPVGILGNRDPEDRSRMALPNGGTFTTAGDYGKFARMLLSDGTVDGKTYLKPETVKLMRTIQTGDLKAGFSPGHGWGLGVGVVKEPQGVTAALSPGTFGHGGAYGTQCWIDPARGVAFIMFVQRSNFSLGKYGEAQANADNNEVRATFQQLAADAIVK